MRSESAKNHQIVEKPPILTQKTSEPTVSSHYKRTDDVCMPPEPTPIVTDLKTRSAIVSSLENDQNIEKSPIFTQINPEPTVSGQSNCADGVNTLPAPTSIATNLDLHSATVGFMKKQQNIEISPIFTQNPPESLVLGRFNWSDDAAKLPIVSTTPTKPPRDFSDLRSSGLPNPFSSLRRRRNYKNPQHFFNSRSQPYCQHTFRNPCYHSPTPHIPYNILQPPPSVPLDWDQDPRLADLSCALQALGWVRR
jgi:hypothetical protein